MEKISQQIEKKVDKKPQGTVFALEDVLPKNSGKREYFRTIKTLSKLQQQNRVTRVRKGLYFIPEKLSFFNTVITEVQKNALEEYYFNKFKNKIYLTGAPMFNRIGLTEQVAVNTVLAVKNPPKDFKDERLFFIKAKCSITPENTKYLQVLDCMEYIEDVSARYPGEVADSLAKFFTDEFYETDYMELIKYAMSYSTRTRAILATIFATIGKEELAKKLRKTYSEWAKFRLFFIEEKCKTFNNKQDYGIYNIK
jgi:exoribonuclease R